MKSKVIVGVLLAAAVLAAGVAQAQGGPSEINGNLKKGGVRYFNTTFASTGIVSLELVLKEGKTDADIVIFDVTDGSDSRDIKDAKSIFDSTVTGYEQGTISAVAGTKIVICVINVSGPGSRFSLFSWSKAGTSIVAGNLRVAAPSIDADGGTFDLYGSASPEMAGIQETLQRLVEAKRR